MLNTSIIMGRLTAEPELKSTTNGKNVLSITVAVDRDYAKDGKRETDFIPVVIWGNSPNNNLAVFVSNHFHKGSMIIIQGRIQMRTFTDNAGNKHKVMELTAEKVFFGGDKAPAEPKERIEQISIPEEEEEEEADELPFFDDDDTLKEDDMPF